MIDICGTRIDNARNFFDFRKSEIVTYIGRDLTISTQMKT